MSRSDACPYSHKTMLAFAAFAGMQGAFLSMWLDNHFRLNGWRSLLGFIGAVLVSPVLVAVEVAVIAALQFLCGLGRTDHCEGKGTKRGQEE